MKHLTNTAEYNLEDILTLWSSNKDVTLTTRRVEVHSGSSGVLQAKLASANSLPE